ncbi:hypothetical protein [Pseudomonas sp. S3E12]|uniref:hypothetical protein n=1 Tax=Pseudomonas sp. S3E12 TaxID=1873126 RepID=UPI00081C1724|nr:hypothetical protein [Pseudomonas sp. S3E12]OCW21611.1 hypothetical protein BB029_23315 [Pseudomonas sp. S3E12]
MNITKALWIATACTLASIAGCTNGQGPNTIEDRLRVTNSSRSNLTLFQGTERHTLDSGANIELPFNGQNVTVTPTTTGADRLDRVVLQFNPDQCSVKLCLVAY